MAFLPNSVDRLTAYVAPPNHETGHPLCISDYYVVMSPNMVEIPRFQFGPNTLRARADGRFGFQDYMQFPQLYNSEICHLPCITCLTPSDPQYEVLEGTDVSIAAFVGRPENPGLGFFKNDMVVPLSELAASTVQVGMEFIANNLDSRDRWPNSLRIFLGQLKAARECLEVAATYPNYLLNFQHVCRLIYNVRAFMQYMLDVRPHVDNLAPLKTNEALVGALCTNIADVQALFNAGVPVWYLQPKSSVFQHTCIRQLVKLTAPSSISPIIVEDSAMRGVFQDMLHSQDPLQIYHALTRYSLTGVDQTRVSETPQVLPLGAFCTKPLVLPPEPSSSSLFQRNHHKKPYTKCKSLFPICLSLRVLTNALAARTAHVAGPSPITDCWREPVCNNWPTISPQWDVLTNFRPSSHSKQDTWPSIFPLPHIFVGTGRSAVYAYGWLLDSFLSSTSFSQTHPA